MPKRWLVKRRLLVVLEATYQVYKDIWAAAIQEVLVCSTEPTNIGKIFVVKLYLHKIISHVFCVQNYFNKANYGKQKCSN